MHSGKDIENRGLRIAGARWCPAKVNHQPSRPHWQQHLQGQSIDSGGASRTFHLCRPQGLTDTVPLVVMLHRGFGNGAQAERSYQSDAEADDGHFLVAYPDGLNRAWNARPVALAFINGIMLTFVAGVAGVRRG